MIGIFLYIQFNSLEKRMIIIKMDIREFRKYSYEFKSPPPPKYFHREKLKEKKNNLNSIFKKNDFKKCNIILVFVFQFCYILVAKCVLQFFSFRVWYFWYSFSFVFTLFFNSALIFVLTLLPFSGRKWSATMIYLGELSKNRLACGIL